MSGRISIPALRENAQRNLGGAGYADVLIQPSKLLALVEAVEEEYRLGDYKTKDRLEARFDFGEQP